ncbi:DUF1990 family protein [Tsukamurella spumae]|uniref:DUF1990 family protein n=1 Tax=Tsukamurella spumae TaxID=44753 RepID=A0A846X1Q5_9ACTN|nr:DUF1990 family protein [Tsukamurella spumae]NKY18445.1 DUF1990 family protein [Tsukamurella spumae]
MTRPEEPTWDDAPSGYRRAEIVTTIGHGDEAFRRAAHDVLRWVVKTRSGFTVSTDEPVSSGQRLTVTARVAGVTVREPVEVLGVVDSARRAGFNYRTLPGHPRVRRTRRAPR